VLFVNINEIKFTFADGSFTSQCVMPTI